VAVRELSSTPSMAALYPKALAGAGLSALRRLPGVGDAARELPDVELVLSEVEVDREHLASYCKVCTFELRERLPVTYPHLLAFPLSMKLMTDTSFPFPVVGLVHIENEIQQARPIGLEERLTVRVRVERLAEHDRGTKFEVVAEAESGGETVWRSDNTYLHREGGGSSGDGGREERPKPPEPTAEWTVPADIGRRYAAVSGDRNPIHLHPLTARLFGLPRPIAHGMWLKARCLALMESLLPEALTVGVSFKLPVFLPARVAFAAWDEGDARAFAVHDADRGKPHLTGRVEPGSASSA
jgi:MaoC like domain